MTLSTTPVLSGRSETLEKPQGFLANLQCVSLTGECVWETYLCAHEGLKLKSKEIARRLEMLIIL